MLTNQSNSKIDKLRLLLNITEGEGKHLGFFLLLFACLGLGMAIGRGSADTLFLKRYGVDYLPVMYITLSVTLALISTLYAAFVDRIPPEKFFQIMLLLQTCVLLFFWLIINLTDFNEIFPAYYLLYEVISEVIIVHAAFYIDQNLDTMQSKRLTPLIFAGYQSGMIIGGIILATVIPVIGIQHAPAIWAVIVLCSSALLFYWHKKKGVSPFFYPPSKSKRSRLHTAINEVKQGIVFMKQSPLLKDASLALFFMVIAFYALSFSVNTIYTNEFTDEAELATFFGILVASTNAFALALQVFVSSRVIEKIGVRKTKLIFPLTMFASFIGLIVNPGFYAGLAASMSKDSIMPAFRNPSRQMFFNVLPDYMKGRARATAVVVVLPAALFVCGILILTLQQTSITLVYILGLICSVIYLYFCYRMGNNYLSTLIGNMKERLFMPSQENTKQVKNTQNLLHDLLTGLNSKDDLVSLSYARLLIKHYKDKSIDAVFKRCKTADEKTADQMIQSITTRMRKSYEQPLLSLSESKDTHFKATILNIVFRHWGHNNKKLIEHCLNSKHERLQTVAIRAVLLLNITRLKNKAIKLWCDLIDGSTEKQLSSLHLIPLLNTNTFDSNIIIQRYMTCIKSLLSCDNQQLKITTYTLLNHWQYGRIPGINSVLIQDTSHHNHNIRSSAVSCLFLLDSIKAIEPHILNAFDDGHLSVRHAADLTLCKLTTNPHPYYLEWIKSNSGTPRAQTEMVDKLISHGTEHSIFKNIIKAKVEYALKLSDASRVLSSSGHNAAVILLINITLKERSSQVIDLVLLLLQPLAQSDIIKVIRAGLTSKDISHKANAREALQNIDDQSTVQLLNKLMDIQHAQNPSPQTTAEEVISWCANANDQWLQFCGQYALRLINNKAT